LGDSLTGYPGGIGGNDQMNPETIAAIWGGIAGGFFAVAAVLVQNWVNRIEQRRAERRILIAVLQAIQDEIESLWDRYMQTAGGIISNLVANTAFTVYYPVGFDYFTIFSGNAFLIGRIENTELRKLIVQTYTHARGLIDSYRMNNVMLEKLERANILATQQPAHKNQVQAELNVLVQYAQRMKESHHRVEQLVERLVGSLRAEIRRLGQ
jgi:hypothetical protein